MKFKKGDKVVTKKKITKKVYEVLKGAGIKPHSVAIVIHSATVDGEEFVLCQFQTITLSLPESALQTEMEYTLGELGDTDSAVDTFMSMFGMKK